MRTKQDVIIAFSSTVKNVLDTTKATIPIEESDIVANCNTSVFNGRKYVRDSLSILDYHRRHKEVRTLVEDSYALINGINYLYLMPYGDHFSRWCNHQFKKEMDENPKFLNDLSALQKMEKKYPFYDDMLETLKEVQKMNADFSEKLQKNLNVLEPSKFELSRPIKQIARKKSRSESSEDFQYTPSSLTKSKTKHLSVKLGIVSAGVSRTTSSESLSSI